jgi:hypothetical protein
MKLLLLKILNSKAASILWVCFAVLIIALVAACEVIKTIAFWKYLTH